MSLRHPASLLLLLAAAGCGSHAPRTPADQATIAACREAADRVYAKQNRAEVYESDRYASTGRDAPFAVENLPGITSRGLSGAFQRDNYATDCLNASGVSDIGTSNAGPSPSALPPPLEHP